MKETPDLIENMCKLYARVNASPNVAKFALLKYLKDNGWHCNLYCVISVDEYPSNAKIAIWCEKQFGAPYHDVDNPRGKWYYFVNCTGMCTDHVFAFRDAKLYQMFLDERSWHTKKKDVLHITSNRKTWM